MNAFNSSALPINLPTFLSQIVVVSSPTKTIQVLPQELNL